MRLARDRLGEAEAVPIAVGGRLDRAGHGVAGALVAVRDRIGRGGDGRAGHERPVLALDPDRDGRAGGRARRGSQGRERQREHRQRDRDGSALSGRERRKSLHLSHPFPRGRIGLTAGGWSPGSRVATRPRLPGTLGVPVACARARAAGFPGHSGGSAPDSHRLPWTTDPVCRPHPSTPIREHECPVCWTRMTVNLTRIYTRLGRRRRDPPRRHEPRVEDRRPRIEAYGTVDELNAQLGVLLAGDDLPDGWPAWLRRVQNDLFDIGADVSTPADRERERLRLAASQTEWLEARCDEVNATLEPLKSFVIPGGTPVAAQLHVCRTTCRRAERRAIAVADALNPEVVRYLNRLSDLLFILARGREPRRRAAVGARSRARRRRLEPLSEGDGFVGVVSSGGRAARETAVDAAHRRGSRVAIRHRETAASGGSGFLKGVLATQRDGERGREGRAQRGDRRRAGDEHGVLLREGERPVGTRQHDRRRRTRRRARPPARRARARRAPARRPRGRGRSAPASEPPRPTGPRRPWPSTGRRRGSRRARRWGSARPGSGSNRRRPPQRPRRPRR